MGAKLPYFLLFLNTSSFLAVLLVFPGLYTAQLIFSGIVVVLMYFTSKDAACLKLAVVYFLALPLAFSTSMKVVQVITVSLPILFPAFATFFAVRNLSADVVRETVEGTRG